jgi:uncharacterized protein YutE (UPF0331/DUF86 family)
MQLDLYQQETDRLARELLAMLDEVRLRLIDQKALTALEQAGVLHALQVLTENAIGKAKLWIKQRHEAVPVSAYDAFAQLHRDKLITDEAMRNWTAAIGLRNRIVHDYLNVDMSVIEALIKEQKYQLQVQFLLTPIHSS